MTGKRLNELERLCNEATPGPWVYENGHLVDVSGYLSDDLNLNLLGNGKFIAEARTAIPELIAEVRRLNYSFDQMSKHALGLTEELARYETQVEKDGTE